MTFKDLNLSLTETSSEIEVCGSKFSVLHYLPIDTKGELVRFVIDGSLDPQTGCFSPLRTEVYASIAVCSYYAGIEFDDEDLKSIGRTYDILEQNGVLEAIIDAIPREEWVFLNDLIDKITADIERYNSSAMGIIENMSQNSSALGEEVTNILDKIKNAEGLENLAAIKDVVGTD